MREDDLRAVLLVKAIEETDRDGAIIPAADRLGASRDAKRALGGEDRDRLLAHRARALLAKVLVRHPFLDDVLQFARGTWAGGVLLAIAFAVGIAMSALDGSRRINVLAFPLFGLLAWNFVVYALLVARPRAAWLPSTAIRLAGGRLAALVAKSRAFNAPLAEALARFVAEWQAAARPLLLARAARVFHLAAAAVGIGLIAGLYLRGIAFAYHAGWESTFLDEQRVRSILAVMYGPASWVTGIAVPGADRLAAIRWGAGGGGEPAARWIHLLAATAAIFVVVPRLLLALYETIAIARRADQASLPASLGAYFRVAFSGVGGLVDRGIVMVVPYAYEPSANALARLRSWIASDLGEHLSVDLRAPIRYGEEDAFVRDVGAQGGELADVIVLVASLAATPEDENHGLVIEGLRDWIARSRPRARLVVLVDEGPYAARMAAPGGAGARLEERRRAWKEFVAARGVEPTLADLAR